MLNVYLCCQIILSKGLHWQLNRIYFSQIRLHYYASWKNKADFRQEQQTVCHLPLHHLVLLTQSP